MSGNIADRLAETARRQPDAPGVLAPSGRDRRGRTRYRSTTFRELDDLAHRAAQGFAARGVQPGMRIALMVRPGLEFITLTFALYRAGAVVVLIDPGMGRSRILECLDELAPQGFVAIPIVHAVRLWRRRRPAFREARINVVVGRRWPGMGISYAQLLAVGARSADLPLPAANSQDPAAIIFTSGSTGPPKGVLYEHGMFNAQVDLIQQQYDIQRGDVDLPGFPLFGLFNAAMGVTTVVPDMDPTRPAQVDAANILDALGACGVTQAFGSPAFWNRIARHCLEHGESLPMLRRGLSAGGPVPTALLERMQQVLTHPGAELHTPYGATESLPATTIGAREVLTATAPLTREGYGTCVGKPFPQVEVKIIAPVEGPLESIELARELPTGEIGEIILRGPSITREYVGRPEATRLAKIPDPRPLPGESRPGVWHRIGDVGRLDASGRLWFCGRKAHVVETANGPMYSVCCEAVIENHPSVYRAALVGVGERLRQRPVFVVEPEPGRFPETAGEEQALREELLQLAAGSPLTSKVRDVLFHRSLPVDTRHNVKIQREQLALWASSRLDRR